MKRVERRGDKIGEGWRGDEKIVEGWRGERWRREEGGEEMRVE